MEEATSANRGLLSYLWPHSEVETRLLFTMTDLKFSHTSDSFHCHCAVSFLALSVEKEKKMSDLIFSWFGGTGRASLSTFRNLLFYRSQMKEKPTRTGRRTDHIINFYIMLVEYSCWLLLSSGSWNLSGILSWFFYMDMNGLVWPELYCKWEVQCLVQSLDSEGVLCQDGYLAWKVPFRVSHARFLNTVAIERKQLYLLILDDIGPSHSNALILLLFTILIRCLKQYFPFVHGYCNILSAFI